MHILYTKRKLKEKYLFTIVNYQMFTFVFLQIYEVKRIVNIIKKK